ncbi:MAG: SCO1664 family protein [Ilumatobacteraceae bacterium]
MSTDELRTPASVPADAATRLSECAIELEGRMPWASNATFLVRVGDHHQGIYKPLRGERPLWDFEPGLHKREVAAYRLSEAMGIGAVPPTVLRPDAPLGEGSVQWFVDADHREHYFTIVEGRPDLHDQLRAIAVLDVIANNTDRKSGHCLLAPGRAGATPAERVWAIDNGLCFATDFKLRTVIWEFAGDELSDELVTACCALAEAVPGEIAELLDDDEVDALRRRAAWLAEHRVLPGDSTGHRYPWPLI